MAEEHRPQQFGGTYTGDMEDAIVTRRKIRNVEDKVQGDATPAADPAAPLMNQSFKSDYKPAPWHTPSRWGD